MLREIGRKTLIYIVVTTGICCIERKPLKINKDNNINFRFYFRNFGCNNGYCTYTDELAIENYVDNTITVNDLSKIALAYTDTAKTDLPIARISFFGELVGHKLPIPLGKNLFEYSENYIASFTFNNSISFNSNNKKLKITKVSIKRGKDIIILEDKIDSILNSNIPLKLDN